MASNSRTISSGVATFSSPFRAATVSIIFHSKSLPESVRVDSAFCWPKAFVANTRAIVAASHMCQFSPQHLHRVERDFGVQRRVALRHDRKYPRGEPGSAFRFGKTDHHQRSCFG